MPVNRTLLHKVMREVRENPEHFTDKHWHQGNKHSFAGFVECWTTRGDFKRTYVSVVCTYTLALKATSLPTYWAEKVLTIPNTIDRLEILVEILTTPYTRRAIELMRHISDEG